MDDLIKIELEEVLEDWNSGRRIPVIPLGHAVRVTSDHREVPHTFRQIKAYSYCFELIEAGMHDLPMAWELFCMLCQSDLAPAGLSAEEKEAAESMAWKALHRGWRKATAGFPEEHEIRIAKVDA